MVEISDHAIIRFMERVKDIDMDIIRAEMRTPALQAAVELGAPVVIGRQGERYLVKNGVLVTVIGKVKRGTWKGLRT